MSTPNYLYIPAGNSTIVQRMEKDLPSISTEATTTDGACQIMRDIERARGLVSGLPGPALKERKS